MNTFHGTKKKKRNSKIQTDDNRIALWETTPEDQAI